MANSGSVKSPNIRVTRIRNYLEKAFTGIIDMSDVKTQDPNERQRHFLSRATAAFAIMCLSSADPQTAAASITDSYDEGGIDAVYLDRAQRILYLVQSKWSENPKKGIEPADFLKLAEGFERILNYELGEFNARIRAKEAEIYEAVHGTSSIVLVLASPAERFGGIDRYARGFLKKHNAGGTSIVSVEQLTLDRLYQFLSGSVGRSSIDISINLMEWGRVETPYAAYYGQVELSEILQWKVHGKSLFDRNLRNFVGNVSEVYESITGTLHGKPEHFWYFNNGVTVLCNSVEKAPVHGEQRKKGLFRCKGVTVVNGAQTVGSIWDVNDHDLDANARVHLRILSLENCPDDFASQVTRASNTQQKIERRDFLALDPNQHRLAREFALDGRRYVFRSGDDAPNRANEIGADDATVALACAQGDINIATEAKREVSKLWANIDAKPYKLLFNDSITSEAVWRAVRILRAVEETLRTTPFTGIPRGRLTAIHGNRFVLYRVFKHPRLRPFRNPSIDIESLAGIAAALASAEVANIASEIATNYASYVPQNIFKNAKQCREIDKRLSTPPDDVSPHTREVVSKDGPQLTLFEDT